jgi:thioredoxin 1
MTDDAQTMLDRAGKSGSTNSVDLEGTTLAKPGLQLFGNRFVSNQVSKEGIAATAVRRSASHLLFPTGGASHYPSKQGGMSAIAKLQGNQEAAVLARAIVEEKGADAMFSASGKVHELDSEEDLDRLLQSSEPVLVEFTTTWCGPCKIFEPKYKSMAAEYGGKAKFAKVTLQKSPATKDLPKRFKVQAIPSFFLFQNGQVVVQEAGIKSETKLRHALDACAR